MDDGQWKAGLEDVIAARSAICAIDGAAGRLFYRGYEIGDLAGAVPYEDVTALLWSGELPDASRAADFRARLTAARGLPAPIEALLRTLPRDCHPLDALRTAISFDAALDRDAADSAPEANLRKSFRLMARVPEIVGAWHRIRTGRAPVTGAGGSHAAYVLTLLQGAAPGDDVARVMDVVLTLHADHEFNASTFAARVVASTGANLHGSTIAGLAAINGPRHGGLTRRVAALFESLKAEADSEAALARRLADGQDLPGFGHPLYPDGDVRAATLFELLRERATGAPELAFAERIAAAGERLGGRKPNVDFAMVTIERVLGLPADSALSMFLLGRTVGWIAHAIEQAAHGGLIRPRARYTGPRPTA